MEVYLKAFSVLSRKRLQLYSPQPVQYSEMCIYADKNGIEDMELFEYLLAKLDAAFLDKSTEKSKTERKKAIPKRGR